MIADSDIEPETASSSAATPTMEDLYNRGRLLPLYLCPFETFLRADSHADYPMAFVVVMRFTGQLKKQEFLTALKGSMDRHRILQCVVGKGKKDRLSWIHKKDLEVEVVWLRDGETIQCRPEFDDSKEAGVRVWVDQGEEQVEVTFYFNHVSVDGVGAHIFIGDLFAIYANEVNGPGTAQLGELDPSLLKNRGYRQRYANLENTHSRTAWGSIKYGIKTALLARSQPLGIPKPDDSAPQSSIPYLRVFEETLSCDEHKKLRDVAIQFGATVNDILSAESFKLFCDWNLQSKPRSHKRAFRIVLPTNLRGRGDDLMPAVNMTSYTFLIRKPDQCNDRITLLKSVREETAKIKNKALGTEFIEAVSRAASTRWVLPLATKLRARLGTIVLTNVGDPTRRYTCRIPRKKGALIAGNLELDACYGCPPLRKHTRATIAITTYKRKLTVSLRCDPSLYKQEHAEKMLRMFMDGLRSWIE
ncbi:hypothetical protein [Novipirellula artificiosorum]|nr:hypothetical protein [Novipirellula artificiosorum]